MEKGPTHLVAIVPLLVTGSGTHCSLERDSKSNLLDRGGVCKGIAGGEVDQSAKRWQ